MDDNDILFCIYEFLSYKELITCSEVNKQLRLIQQDQQLWYMFCKKQNVEIIFESFLPFQSKEFFIKYLFLERLIFKLKLQYTVGELFKLQLLSLFHNQIKEI